MKTSTILMFFSVVLIGVIATVYWKYYFGQEQQPAVPGLEKPLAARKTEPVVPPPGAPVPVPPGVEQEKPLPPLNDSDGTMQEVLTALFPRQNLDKLLVFNNFIKRFVLMVDNLPRKSLPAERLPTRPAPGKFVTTGEEGSEFISPDNYQRYTPYVRFAEAVDAKQLVSVYLHFYPLFQEAYKQLGYPSRDFNDRLLEVINQLLVVPEIQGPIRVVRPSIFYEYADPELEALSAGQKILIRAGEANAKKIRTKLRSIRDELTSRTKNP